MSVDVILKPTVFSDEEFTHSVNLQLFVKEQQVEEYDQIEVWRAKDGGVFEELTASQYLAPVLPSGAGGVPTPPVTGASVALNALALVLKLSGEKMTITFSGTDPITYADAATQIVAQGSGRLLSWVDSNGVLVVSSYATGTSVELEVFGGDAAPQLGLMVGALANGRDARIRMTKGTLQYSFTDYRGNQSYTYRTRFRNSSMGAVSTFSHEVKADQNIGVTPSNVICGSVHLIWGNGAPMQGVSVQVSVEYSGEVVDGAVVAGGPLLKTTDKNGRAEFPLVRGARAVVSIAGTNLNRSIRVPTDPTIETFDLLDPAVSDSDDLFKASVPDIITAERRTL